MIPNPDQEHSSISTTDTASTMATRGYTVHAKTGRFLVQAVGGDVRFTFNGTNPTASAGHKLADGEMIELNLVQFIAMKVITGASAPKLEVSGFLNS
jgi:hypothetical protein